MHPPRGSDEPVPAVIAAGRGAARATDGVVAAAFAASIAIHVGAIAAATAVAAWPQADSVSAPSGTPPVLQVVLAPPTSTALPPGAPRAGTVAVGAAVRMAGAPPPTRDADRTATAFGPVQGVRRTAPDTAGAGVPRVVVDDQVPRARFADALDQETLAGIPVEVDMPVRLPGRLVVPYPPDALAAGREGIVLAWSIVDENGTAEEPRIVEGPPEFAEAVKAALRATRFAPARDGGAPVRFYVTLQFAFRIEAGPAATAHAAAAR